MKEILTLEKITKKRFILTIKNNKSSFVFIAAQEKYSKRTFCLFVRSSYITQ
jgi:hypothetical protein